MKNWFANLMNVVKLDYIFSECFPVNHGTKQGSVLSLTSFYCHNIIFSIKGSQAKVSASLGSSSAGHNNITCAAPNFSEAVRVQGNCVMAFCSTHLFTLKQKL